MSDLKRLDEAADDVDEIYSYIKGDYFDEKWGLGEKAERVKGLLRAYRDLLANGERVEPDYEAAAWSMYKIIKGSLDPGWKPNVGQVEMARRVVDAAIGDRLLVNPTTEEER